MRPSPLVLTLALCAGAEETPEAPGVTVEISAERTEFALGDPILVDVVFRNEGEGTAEIEESHRLRFRNAFEVRDALGVMVPNPYLDLDTPNYDGKSTVHKLRPGTTISFPMYVNECAAFEKPGEYVVTARRPSKPLKIRVLPAPDKKDRDRAVADLMALWRNPKLRECEEYARYRPYITEHNGSTDALRLLAFLREPELLPFWIEGIEVTGKRTRFRSAFAPEALAGLPDRAAVLKALEARLDRSADPNVLTTYVLLAVPESVENAFARRKEIRDRYEDK